MDMTEHSGLVNLSFHTVSSGSVLCVYVLEYVRACDTPWEDFPAMLNLSPKPGDDCYIDTAQYWLWSNMCLWRAGGGNYEFDVIICCFKDVNNIDSHSILS